MNILMMTNTYAPHVGGVARSVQAFAAEHRKNGHRVLVVAPEFENMPSHEVDVARVPAIQNFNGSDFSVVYPVPGFLHAEIEAFDPDIVHSHHPFLLGATAMRVAHARELPLVFTHHTMYERYTHYVPGDSDALKRFVVTLSTSYANLCDRVFAPSGSVAAVLEQRGVMLPIDVVPTGVQIDAYQQGSGSGFRAAMNIPEDAFVVGHVGRLAPEKNLEFLAEAAANFLAVEPSAHCLVVGVGPSSTAIAQIFDRRGLIERLHVAGILDQPLLASAYRAMDVFAFASKSETQGMVLTEAMAAGVPVVALDAPGAREVVDDGRNGRLLIEDTKQSFSAALAWVAGLPEDGVNALRHNASETAETFSMPNCAAKAFAAYRQLYEQEFVQRHAEYNAWRSAARMVEAEWEILRGVAEAAGAAFAGSEPPVESRQEQPH